MYTTSLKNNIKFTSLKVISQNFAKNYDICLKFKEFYCPFSTMSTLRRLRPVTLNLFQGLINEDMLKQAFDGSSVERSA